ncbi:hypothetical protein ACFQE5_21955 [Pseudonocardia hispaniensis]|uniref:Uncharacterized protein n=1 Tax=Pseudonocardia hispaniensis TaxID=904933 RepID=A0ABW1J7L1_9PSEU
MDREPWPTDATLTGPDPWEWFPDPLAAPSGLEPLVENPPIVRAATPTRPAEPASPAEPRTPRVGIGAGIPVPAASAVDDARGPAAAQAVVPVAAATVAPAPPRLAEPGRTPRREPPEPAPPPGPGAAQVAPALKPGAKPVAPRLTAGAKPLPPRGPQPPAVPRPDPGPPNGQSGPARPPEVSGAAGCGCLLSLLLPPVGLLLGLVTLLRKPSQVERGVGLLSVLVGGALTGLLLWLLL